MHAVKSTSILGSTCHSKSSSRGDNLLWRKLGSSVEIQTEIWFLHGPTCLCSWNRARTVLLLGELLLSMKLTFQSESCCWCYVSFLLVIATRWCWGGNFQLFQSGNRCRRRKHDLYFFVIFLFRRLLLLLFVVFSFALLDLTRHRERWCK